MRTVEAIDGLFGILDEGDLPADTADWSNGLVAVMSAGALIATGVAFGPVRVQTATSLEAPPAANEGDGWDEIIEVTVQAPTGRLRAHSLEDSSFPELPVLSTHGRGPYRLRVHARGRANQAAEDPVEDYLLQIWPAGADEDVVILRSSERIERALSEPWTTEGAPEPEPCNTRKDDEELRARLLRGGGSHPLPDTERGSA
ncbi:hypothetical protein [Streptomyces aureocirculatus]|uniref:hypothetical protein n=1 Tax=Streptomyces aureocirculatus TaxID=67275 RepID=UPI0004CAAF63|nr:hypothetical protein [Streptomyces aureocirculatus]